MQGFVARRDRGAVGEDASDVEVEDLSPAESVAERPLGDRPVAVVASDGDGGVLDCARRCRWISGARDRRRHIVVDAGTEDFNSRGEALGVELGEDRDRCRGGLGTGGLYGRGDHEDPGDQARSCHLEAGKHR